MTTIHMFVSLPLSDQKRIATTARKIARLSRSVYYCDEVFSRLVEVEYARHQNRLQDITEARRSRFA